MEQSPTPRVSQHTIETQQTMANERSRSKEHAYSRDPAGPAQEQAHKTHDHVHRAMWIVLLDVEASKSNRDHDDYKYKDSDSRKATLEELYINMPSGVTKRIPSCILMELYTNP